MDLDLTVLKWEGFILPSELEKYSSNGAAAFIWKYIAGFILFILLPGTKNAVLYIYAVEHSWTAPWIWSFSLKDVLEEEGKKKKNYLDFAAVVVLIPLSCKMSCVSRDNVLK